MCECVFVSLLLFFSSAVVVVAGLVSVARICVPMLILSSLFHHFGWLARSELHLFFRLFVGIPFHFESKWKIFGKHIRTNNLIKERHEWSIKKHFFVHSFVLIKTRESTRDCFIETINHAWIYTCVESHRMCVIYVCIKNHVFGWLATSNFHFPCLFDLIF